MADQQARRPLAGPLDGDRNILSSRIAPSTMLAILAVAAVLHVGSEVFLPLAIATLFAFTLSPIVSALRRQGWPRILAVLTSVVVAFSILGVIITVMAGQLALVVEGLPSFQSNIIAKLETLQSSVGSSGVMGQLIDMLARINAEIGSALPNASQTPSGPVEVTVVEHQSVWGVLQTLVLPVISPLITAGLVVVVVIFMLLEREEIRDRFIRLAGSNDLHRTTEMLGDAGSRVAGFLLTQLLVNVIYAIPIGFGLWAIGVPNPLLWGLLTLVLRFVPYLGPVIAAAMPLFLAFAVSPDWSMVLWVAALFVTVELITSNIVEPWLYGSRTGLSPLAVIVAAIFWTFIWGPAGLILSTPLTVCLVVLGRYLPQFEVFDILFGDEPVLSPHARLYQRLLTGELVESASRAEEALETFFLAEFHQDVTIPALLLAQSDFERGVLSQAQTERLAVSGLRLADVLDVVVAEELDEAVAEDLPGRGLRIVVAGGRSQLDDVAARMLGQAIGAEGAEVTPVTRAEVMTLALPDADGAGPDCVLLSFLDPNPSRAALLVVRRIKRALPRTRVGVVIWDVPEDLARKDGLQGSFGGPKGSALQMAQSVGADFAVTTMDEALREAFVKDAAKPLEPARPRPSRKVAA